MSSPTSKYWYQSRGSEDSTALAIQVQRSAASNEQTPVNTRTCSDVGINHQTYHSSKRKSKRMSNRFRKKRKKKRSRTGRGWQRSRRGRGSRRSSSLSSTSPSVRSSTSFSTPSSTSSLSSLSDAQLTDRIWNLSEKKSLLKGNSCKHQRRNVGHKVNRLKSFLSTPISFDKYCSEGVQAYAKCMNIYIFSPL